MTESNIFSTQVKKAISYAESADEDDDVVAPSKVSKQRRASKQRKPIFDDDDDDEDDADFPLPGLDGAADEDEDGLSCPRRGYSASTNSFVDDMDDFVVSDDSDAPTKFKKRKRPAPSTNKPRKRSNVSTPAEAPEEEDDLEILTGGSTARQWTYDPDNTEPLQPRPVTVSKAVPSSGKKYKEKAHKSEPEDRYPWLANLLDMDRNAPGSPDYDPRTVYIPPLAWQKFSAFEKQYWEIKQKFWDTIVFFKKGKFYELYENDATIGHQLFDLKLTDRVNMRMVGVPESSLDHWANQFVAKGFKIARVDQMESALGKEMREREDSVGLANKPKKDKVINRELACVLTKGTLVDGSMLEDDMSTYCVAIKEGLVDDVPAFGVAFVDTATGQFFMTEFVDDVDLTKFETFVAQTRPQELLLEKSCISVKALRILKNNTNPTTIWNYLKPGKEFWDADTTKRELECSGYFTWEESPEEETWPKVLTESKDKVLLMSAFGALVQYLRTLKLERNLLTQGNFTWYDPIQKATTLVLDGQTLINLEIFANTFDGGQEGTLFTLLNRCVTPFGKRMFRQWVCHPLADPKRINERLDAVDSLNADRTVREQFTSQMTRMPDLERLISRIHAGSCRPEDFVRVLEGFEQIEYTMSLLGAFGGADGIIDRLLGAMPDLKEPLEYWKTAFDRAQARDSKLLIPERGIEEDFDASQDRIAEIKAELQALLSKQRKALGSNAIQFRDIGKEIYQLEVPAKVKNVPSTWTKMSATKDLKRYYFPELKALIRELQEAQETHGQIVKATSSRFFARFDEHYDTWLAAVKVIAHLDCLISLAKASSALGEPSCRPVFVEDERSVIEFEELRHPCVLPNVSDFIPNDINLGGSKANITLLTGANAAGKSTILRMVGPFPPCPKKFPPST
jgi:DNA mismatch repair protein MSH6